MVMHTRAHTHTQLTQLVHKPLQKMTSVMFAVGTRSSQSAHQNFQLKVYHPQFLFSIHSRSSRTQIKRAAASVKSNILVMPEEQMRQAVYYVDICTFWQNQNQKLDFNIL